MSAARKLPEPSAYLGVEQSLTGRRWSEASADTALAEDHRRRYGLPEIAARLLAGRGVSAADAQDFLEPTLKRLFPDPSTFKDMDEAARVIEDAIVTGRPSAVFCDYDVDGATSGAQLVRYFRARGRTLQIYVPDRMTEGYGPSPLAFERLKAQGVEFVITVDCGAVAEDALNAAAELGLDVVVLDHHLMHGPPPKARAVVNPNRPDDHSGQGDLTAAGVVLVALAAVNREARKRGSIGANNLPNPLENLDLSALGTVCDVAPLKRFNRAIVAQGLKVLRGTKNVGLIALAKSAGRETCGEVYDLGFVLGPRINAGGRVGDASIATRLLSTDDPEEAAMLAEELEALNAERRKREADMLLEAEVAAVREAERSPVIVVGAPHWHPGVIGIAAGRLKDRLMKPTIVLGGAGEGEPAKGSGRSTPGVNLGAAVAAAKGAGILHAGGGHAMAAGLTMDWDRIDELRTFLAKHMALEIEGAAGEARSLTIDAAAAIPALDLDLLAALDRIGPYGPGHPDPLFAIAEVRVAFAKRVKDAHVRFTLEDARGARISGIAFQAMTRGFGEALLKGEGVFHAAVRVKRNDYGGRSRAEIEIVDLAQAR